MTEDRHLVVEPGRIIKTAWIDIDLCVLGNRERMDAAAIERCFRELLQLAPCQKWPCINGHWREDGRFVIHDGRHEYLALLASGREQILIAWLEQEAVSNMHCTTGWKELTRHVALLELQCAVSPKGIMVATINRMREQLGSNDHGTRISIEGSTLQITIVCLE